MLSLDVSFVIQIVSFLVLWFALKYLLFDPFVRVLDERQQRTVGTSEQAARTKVQAEATAAEYERRLHDVRVQLAAAAAAAQAATQAAQRELLAAAQGETTTQLAQLRENLSRQMEATRPTLATAAQELAADMAGRVVGRPLV